MVLERQESRFDLTGLMIGCSPASIELSLAAI